jgi:hypothetical protein
VNAIGLDSGPAKARLEVVKRLPAALALSLLVGCGSQGNPDEATQSPVRLNEFSPSNATLADDEAGEFDDWIEIMNSSDAAVSLEGYWISDTAGEPSKYTLPAGVEVPAGGFLLLWADNTVAQGPLHLPFKLKAAAEGVYFSSPDGDLIDGLDYTAAPADQSMSRFPDGTGTFVWCAAPTPGATNDPSCGG